MPDYKKMYYVFFDEISMVISSLQEAQQKTKEMYMSDAGLRNLTIIRKGKHKQPPKE